MEAVMQKMLLPLTLSCFLLFAPSAWAQTDHDSHPGHGEPQVQTDAAGPDTSGHEAHDMGQHMQMMQEHMQKMRARMETIKSTASARQKRSLMQEQIADMEKGMEMLTAMPMCKMMASSQENGQEKQGMMGSGGMGSGMMGPGGMACCKMMQSRMEMMQTVVEGLVESSKMNK
jgi:hypothetical protein